MAADAAAVAGLHRFASRIGFARRAALRDGSFNQGGALDRGLQHLMRGVGEILAPERNSSLDANLARARVEVQVMADLLRALASRRAPSASVCSGMPGEGGGFEGKLYCGKGQVVGAEEIELNVQAKIVDNGGEVVGEGGHFVSDGGEMAVLHEKTFGDDGELVGAEGQVGIGRGKHVVEEKVGVEDGACFGGGGLLRLGTASSSVEGGGLGKQATGTPAPGSSGFLAVVDLGPVSACSRRARSAAARFLGVRGSSDGDGFVCDDAGNGGIFGERGVHAEGDVFRFTAAPLAVPDDSYNDSQPGPVPRFRLNRKTTVRSRDWGA